MQGIKMILVGMLLVLVGIAVLAILVIPGASLSLMSVFSGLPAVPVTQAYGQFDSGILEAVLNFERAGIIAAAVLMLAGLVLAGFGMIRRN